MRKYSTALLTGLIAGPLLVILLHYRQPISGYISATVSAIGRAILKFADIHPGVLSTLRIVVNSVPDVTVLLLALAGLVYLMPKLAKRIEESTILRRAVAIAFVLFSVVAIVVNGINRAEQEQKEVDHIQIERDNSDRVFQVQSSLSKLQGALLESRGKTGEFERRKGVLDSLRAEYVLSHKDAPVSMITGSSYPPREWMAARLKQLGETWTYIQPAQEARGGLPIVNPPPPGIELLLATGNDDANSVEYSLKKGGDSWYQQEKRCQPPFRCFSQHDLQSQQIELSVGEKKWVRVFFVVYNTGGSPLRKPVVEINLGRGHGVSINRMNDHHPLGTSDYRMQQFGSPELSDIVPFDISQNGTSLAVDLAVDPTINTFTLVIRVYGENLKSSASIVEATFKVNKIA
jgi:hypothetical protein